MTLENQSQRHRGNQTLPELPIGGHPFHGFLPLLTM